MVIYYWFKAFSLRKLGFMQFTKAVEAKQVAQQEAERARFVVMKADQVNRSNIVFLLCRQFEHKL